MEFFKHDDGSMHGGRMAGVLYMVSLAPWYGRPFTPMFVARAVFGIGWWLAFCDKRSLRWAEVFGDARHVAGVILNAIGLAAQFALLDK